MSKARHPDPKRPTLEGIAEVADALRQQLQFPHGATLQVDVGSLHVEAFGM